MIAMDEMKEEMQQLRYRASELLLTEKWKESIDVYSHFISLCKQQLSLLVTHKESDSDQASKHKKSLCLALSNRAEARSRLRDFSHALEDCDEALQIESTHVKALVCKGKILLDLDCYSKALDCFRQAAEIQNSGSCETLHGLLDRCKKLEFLSRKGAFDLSEWILNGYGGKHPELAEYIGPILIKKLENYGRGLFAAKSVEAGTLLLVTKAVAVGRAILPDHGDDCDDGARLVMWKDFVNKILDSAAKCRKTLQMIYTLSTGEDEDDLEVPDMKLFRPEMEMCLCEEKLDTSKILKILDVNSLTEDAISAKILGKNSDYCGVGLWILASFVNHSCNPNVRRLHIGDHMAIHASRDVKEGEEITFAYFDVFLPLKKRRELSSTWGFSCNCKRCRFEEVTCLREEVRELEIAMEGESDMGGIVAKLEEGMKRWMMKEKEKGFLRASFWSAFSHVFKSEKLTRKWGRRIPAAEVVAQSIAEAVGGDERVLKVVVSEGLKRGGGVVEMERAMKLGRGVYGKVMKKQAMRALLELSIYEQCY